MSMEFAESKKTRKPLPEYAIIIIVIAAITGIIGIIKGVLSAQINQAAAEITETFNGYSSSAATSSYDGVTPVAFKNLSIMIPEGWTYETIEGKPGAVDRLYLESQDSETSNIYWLRVSDAIVKPTLREWLQPMYDSLGDSLAGALDDSFDNFVAEDITEFPYCGEGALSFNYKYDYMGFQVYGQCIALLKDGNYVMVMNTSDLRSHLASRFDFIEKTLTLD